MNRPPLGVLALGLFMTLLDLTIDAMHPTLVLPIAVLVLAASAALFVRGPHRPRSSSIAGQRRKRPWPNLLIDGQEAGRIRGQTGFQEDP